jgi:hypothetical protein
MEKILLLMFLAFALNVPFGYLRARSRKYSFRWFLWIHLPVPFVILSRLVTSTDYRIIPLLLIASLAGQFLGGRIE